MQTKIWGSYKREITTFMMHCKTSEIKSELVLNYPPGFMVFSVSALISQEHFVCISVND